MWKGTAASLHIVLGFFHYTSTENESTDKTFQKTVCYTSY